jgi:hypothetical protein
MEHSQTNPTREKKRYQVRIIGTGKFGRVIGATDDLSEAKRLAQDHAWDGEYGTAVLDILTQTVDLGDRTVPIREAFAALAP